MPLKRNGALLASMALPSSCPIQCRIAAEQNSKALLTSFAMKYYCRFVRLRPRRIKRELKVGRANVPSDINDVRFTPESGHDADVRRCLFLTPSGHHTLAALFGGIHLPKPESLCKGVSYASSAIQNHVDVGAIKAMAARKCFLAAFLFNCGPQQTHNFIVIKYKRLAPQAAGTFNDT
jgi:hypothetical protein